MPLYVDLDDTLTVGDSLWDATAQLLFTRPVSLVGMIVAMFGGRPSFKRYVSANTPMQPGELIYRRDVLDYVADQRRSGRRIVLATGAHRLFAERAAAHLNLFDAVLATDAATNLTRENKLNAIREDCGGKPFEYIGDSPKDLPVWQAAAAAAIVAPRPELLEALHAFHPAPRLLGSPTRRSLVRPILRAFGRPNPQA